MVSSNKTVKRKKELKNNEVSIKTIWDHIKRNNIIIIGSEGGEGEKEQNSYFKKLREELNIQIQKSQNSKSINPGTYQIMKYN